MSSPDRGPPVSSLEFGGCPRAQMKEAPRRIDTAVWRRHLPDTVVSMEGTRSDSPRTDGKEKQLTHTS